MRCFASLRPDIFGRFLVAVGLLRVADERGADVRIGWPRSFDAADVEGDVDGLFDAVVEDAKATTPLDLPGHPLRLLAGQQTFITTLRAALPLLTIERVRDDLLTPGRPHEAVATLRWDAERIQPAALRGGDGTPGAGSRGCPSQEFLAWRALGGSLWTPLYHDQGVAPGVVWPVWSEMLAPDAALRFIDGGASSWAGRAATWSARVSRSEGGYHREVKPGRPAAGV